MTVRPSISRGRASGRRSRSHPQVGACWGPLGKRKPGEFPKSCQSVLQRRENGEFRALNGAPRGSGGAPSREGVTGCVTAARLTSGVTRFTQEEQELEAMNAINVIRPMDAVARTQERCLVCGFSEIRTDEVVDRGVVFLAECPHCDHRWTSSEPIAAADTAATMPMTARYQRVPARVAREVLPAA